MLYHLGFACRQEDDVLRAGPYKKSEDITASDMQQMDRYMMRAWVEMQTALTSYIHLTGKCHSTNTRKLLVANIQVSRRRVLLTSL